MSEIKNTLDGINCRLDIAEEKKLVKLKTQQLKIFNINYRDKKQK